MAGERRKIQRLDASFNKYSPDVVAKPVDTYVTPGKGSVAYETTVLHKPQTSYTLASALADFHKPLTRFMRTKLDEAEAEGEAKGKKLFEESSGKLSWQDFIKANKTIPINDSVKRGYLMARASNEAMLVESAMKYAYIKGEAFITDPNTGEKINVRESDDPTVFNEWIRKFTQGYVEKNMGKNVPPDIFSNIFMPQIEDGIRKLTNYHINQQQEQLYMKAEAELGEMLNNTIHEHIKDGAFVMDDSVDGMRDLASNISEKVKAFVAQGLPVDRARGAVVNMLSAYASDDNVKNTEELLHIAKLVEVSTGIHIGNLGDDRVRIEREAEAKERRLEAREERQKREQKEADADARDAVFVGFLEAVLSGKKPSKADILEAVKGMKGVTPQEVSAIVSQMQNVADLWKPPTDHYYETLARHESQAKALFAFLNKTGGDYTAEDITKAAPGLGWSNAVDLLARKKNEKTPFGNIQNNFAGMVQKDIMTYVFNGEDYTKAPMTLDKGRAVETAVWSDVKKELEKNPTQDFGEIQTIIQDVTRKRSKEFKDTNPVVFEKMKDITGGSDMHSPEAQLKSKKLNVIFKNQQTFNGFKGLASEHNAYVARGGTPEESGLVRKLKELNITPAEFEANTGIKLNMAPAPTAKKQKEPGVANAGGNPKTKTQVHERSRVYK